jgi:hypothetical protein
MHSATLMRANFAAPFVVLFSKQSPFEAIFDFFCFE